jgi:Uma2 family endonuclease
MALAAPPRPRTKPRHLQPTKPRYFTVAEVIERLGDIPMDRILNHPEPGTATEQDVLDLDDHEDILCELIDGILVRKPMGFEESRIAFELGAHLAIYLDKTGLGFAAGADGMLTLSQGQIRIPDVSVMLWDHVPGGDFPKGRVPHAAPHVAVEVLSDSNTKSEMERKLKEYFDAGTLLVWIIDPPTRTVKVHTSPDRFTLLKESDILEGGDLLPGFTVSIRSLFKRASLRRKQ